MSSSILPCTLLAPQIIEGRHEKHTFRQGYYTPVQRNYATIHRNSMGNDRRQQEIANRLTDVLVTMNTPADWGKLFKIIKMLYRLMGLTFSEEDEPMNADPAVLEYFIFSFTADFDEVMQDLIAEETE